MGSDDASINDDAASRLTLTYTDAFKVEPVVIASAVDTTNSQRWCTIRASSTTACTIDVGADDGAQTNDPESVFVLVLGTDHDDEF